MQYNIKERSLQTWLSGSSPIITSLLGLAARRSWFLVSAPSVCGRERHNSRMWLTSSEWERATVRERERYDPGLLYYYNDGNDENRIIPSSGNFQINLSVLNRFGQLSFWSFGPEPPPSSPVVWMQQKCFIILATHRIVQIKKSWLSVTSREVQGILSYNALASRKGIR